jgi:hypothetical protein
MNERQRDGLTIVMPFCESCPPLIEWPDKNLTTGCCPRCGRVDENGWRMAVARRIIAEHEGWGQR